MGFLPWEGVLEQQSAGVGQEMARECPSRLGLFVWAGWCLSLMALLSSLFFCGAKRRKQVSLPSVSKG